MGLHQHSRQKQRDVDDQRDDHSDELNNPTRDRDTPVRETPPLQDEDRIVPEESRGLNRYRGSEGDMLTGCGDAPWISARSSRRLTETGGDRA